MARFDGKVAIVTGGGSGIGAETARRFGAEGARVIVSALEAEAAQAVADAIVAEGGQAIGIGGDITDEKIIEGIVAQAINTFGRIDILHNNAAATGTSFILRDKPIAEMDLDLWQSAYAINVFAPALFCKHVVPHMLAQRGGSIVMSASGKGIRGDLTLPAYGTSKAAVISLAQYVATMYGKGGVRANAVVIGFTRTDSVAANMAADAVDLYASHHLTPSVGSPDKVADVVLFLASDAASHITAAAIPVDGGYSAHTSVFADVMRAGRTM